MEAIPMPKLTKWVFVADTVATGVPFWFPLLPQPTPKSANAPRMVERRVRKAGEAPFLERRLTSGMQETFR